MSDPKSKNSEQQPPKEGKQIGGSGSCVRCGDVWVKKFERDDIPKAHNLFSYFFVTGVSLDHQWVVGMKIDVLCALGDNHITTVHPNYKCYIAWFGNAKLIDTSQLPFVQTKIVGEEDAQPKTGDELNQREADEELDKLKRDLPADTPDEKMKGGGTVGPQIPDGPVGEE